MRRLLAGVFILWAPLAAAGPVQETLDALRASHAFPGATVAWADADGLEARAAGWADPDRGVPMTPATRMLAASIGKSFTAAAALSLQAEGALDLDAPLGRWLGGRPWFERVPNHDTLTLRHLLTHSGGLPDHVHLPAFAALFAATRGDAEPPKPEALIALVLDAEPLFAPGDGWAYSDTGYLLAALAIEEAAGRPWTEVVAQRFLDPLNLASTGPSDRRHLARLAVGIADGSAGLDLPARTLDPSGALVWHPGIEGAGGGFVSAAGDLARWGRALWSGRAMQTAYLDEMLEGVPTGEPGVTYGLGVSVRTRGPFGEVRGHGGWIPGYVASLRYYPARDTAIAVMINTDVGMLGDDGAFPAIEAALTRAILEGGG
jgi:D-alanyl-D-alanine carboxypeptidase